MKLDPLLTIEEVAQTLKLDARGVEQLIQGGELAALRIGGELRVTPGDLRRFVNVARRDFEPADSGKRPGA